MTPGEILESLEHIRMIFGPYLGALVVITFLSIGVLLLFLKSRVVSLADEISKKAITAFETKMQLSLRDEQIRRDIVLYLAKKSIDKKLEMYNEVYKLYFDYQRSWSFDGTTPQEDIETLNSQLLAERKKIFLSAIYLGGPLTDSLLKAVITMHTLLERQLRKINNPYGHLFEKHMYDDSGLFNSERKLGEYLHAAERQLATSIKTDHDLVEYDFSEEQKQTLSNEKEKLFSN